MAKFTIGTDDESEGSIARQEVPMGDDDNQPIEMMQRSFFRDERFEFGVFRPHLFV